MNLQATMILKGKEYHDERGTIFHNNDFHLSEICRTYIIENKDLEYCRGWKGHRIENRWFLCVKGAVKVYVSSIENLEKKINDYHFYELQEDNMDILYVPSGNATLIKQLVPKSRIMAFSDWFLGLSGDENLRWPNNIFQL